MQLSIFTFDASRLLLLVFNSICTHIYITVSNIKKVSTWRVTATKVSLTSFGAYRRQNENVSLPMWLANVAATTLYIDMNSQRKLKNSNNMERQLLEQEQQQQQQQQSQQSESEEAHYALSVVQRFLRRARADPSYASVETIARYVRTRTRNRTCACKCVRTNLPLTLLLCLESAVMPMYSVRKKDAWIERILF